MPSDYYLKIDKVEGESVAKGMEKQIELDSWSFGISSPSDVGGGGLSAGKPSCSDLSFSFALDKASPPILAALCKGTHIATVVFTGRKTGGGGQPYNYLVITLTNCFVTGYSLGGGAQGVPSASSSVAYEQIQYEYFLQDTVQGTTTNAGTATYNIGQVNVPS